MIKELINDIVYDKINLNQALTRAKLIAFKIENNILKEWISNELTGYTSGDLPSHRILSSETVGIISNSLGQEQEIQLGLGPKMKEILDGNFHIYHFKLGISSVEGLLNENKEDIIYLHLPPETTELFSEYLTLPAYTTLKYILKKIGRSQLQHIINITKQNLIDTLLDLNKEFPDLESDFDSKEMKEKANKIITNHIHGNVSHTNFGIGDNVKQKQKITQSQLNKNLGKLKEFGVEDEDIEILKDIVHEDDTEIPQNKLIKWIGDVTKKSIEKGIELKLPEIMDTIQNLV